MLQVKRSGLDRTRKRRPRAAGRVLTDPIDRLILEVARASPSDGSRMVAALAGREFGRQVNRKRAQGVMRMERLLQRQRPLRRRRRPGFFRVECPDQLWQLEMTSVWVAEPGWCYVNAAIDCCTGEIVGWSLELRCRSEAAPALVDTAVAAGGIEPAALTLGTDNGSAFTSRGFRARLAEHGVRRRGGYRDPESQAFIESWFGKLKERRAPSSRRSSKRERRSPTTSTATTTDRTPASASERRPRYVGHGRMITDYKNSGLKCRARRGPGHKRCSLNPISLSVERPMLSRPPDNPSGATRPRDCPAHQVSYLSTRDGERGTLVDAGGCRARVAGLLSHFDLPLCSCCESGGVGDGGGDGVGAGDVVCVGRVGCRLRADGR